jgi:uncharacterized membrane protein
MELSPEDKKRIYEEEKARIEAREKIEREKLTEAAGAGTSTGLSPNVAGLLCYVGIWISGIIFFVLEQKNRFVRFHAAQSIVAFGTITVAGIILGLIPVVGDVFISIIVIIGVIVWIIMIVKASSGEWYKLPGVGDVAEKMVASSGVAGEYSEPPPSEPTEEPEETTPPPAADSGKGIGDKIDAHFKGRTGRITASAFAIAWSIALLIFFNFFNQYVAYYHSETIDGITTWIRYPFFTEDINLWLPVLTATLIITIIGHIILIVRDRYILREMIHIVINAFSLWTVLTLLTVFPFDFSVIPDPAAADATDLGVRIFLIFISVAVGIAILVRVIKLIVNVVRGTTGYEEHI